MRVPMARDIDAAADPDTGMPLDVVEEALEAGGAGRVTGNAQMQADRHHLRRARALAIKHVESIAQGLEELARGRDGSEHDLGVVVREAVGDEEMGPESGRGKG